MSTLTDCRYLQWMKLIILKYFINKVRDNCTLVPFRSSPYPFKLFVYFLATVWNQVISVNRNVWNIQDLCNTTSLTRVHAKSNQFPIFPLWHIQSSHKKTVKLPWEIIFRVWKVLIFLSKPMFTHAPFKQIICMTVWHIYTNCIVSNQQLFWLFLFTFLWLSTNILKYKKYMKECWRKKKDWGYKPITNINRRLW